MQIDNDLIKSVKITPILESLQLEDVSDEDYFSVRMADYISNSRLGLLKNQGAEAFFAGLKSEYNPSFELGELVHQQVLQPESFFVVPEIFKPTAKAGLMAEKLYKSDGTTPTDDEIKSMSYVVGYYKDKLTTNRLSEFRQKAEPYWRDRYIYEQNNPFKEGDKKRIYTNQGYFEILQSCLKSLEENTEIQKLLHPSGIVEEPIVGNEKTILLNIKMELDGYEAREYKLKAKLDNFSIDKEENIITVNDLKTSSRPAVMFDPDYFSYFREIAGYSWLLKLCAKKFYNIEKATQKVNFLVVSTIPEYTTKLYSMNTKEFMKGWKEYIFLLKSVYYLNVIKGYEFS